MLNNQFASLLPVAQSNINAEIQLTVDARQLHGALQVGRDFSTWFKDRVTEAQFDEGIDYFQVLEQSDVELPRNGGSVISSSGMKQAKNYSFTLDAAKEVAMLERNSIGKQVRKYFIEAEKAYRLDNREVIIEKAKDPENFSLTDRITAANVILSQHYEGNQLVLALDKVHVRLTGESVLKIAEVQLIAPQQKQLYTPTEIGKSIEPPCSAVKVNKYLEAMGWQIKANDKWEAVNDGVPYAVYLDTGKAHSDGTPIRQMKWTADTIFALQAYLNQE